MTALDLGWIEEESIAAETPALVESFEAAGFQTPISPQELCCARDYGNPTQVTDDGQCVIGTKLPEPFEQ